MSTSPPQLRKPPSPTASVPVEAYQTEFGPYGGFTPVYFGGLDSSAIQILRQCEPQASFGETRYERSSGPGFLETSATQLANWVDGISSAVSSALSSVSTSGGGSSVPATPSDFYNH